jgi:hypothetical protein
MLSSSRVTGVVKKWYERPLRVFDLALEDPYGQWLDRWTAEDMVRTAVAANASVLNMMIINEWGQAYFPVSQLPHHPALSGEDRLAAVLEEAAKSDLRVVGMWGPTPNPHLYERYPEWAKLKEDGSLYLWGMPQLDPCQHICHNSPYGEIILETLDKLFGAYPIDGVAFDYFISLPCYCEFCRDKFLAACDLDLRQHESWIGRERRRLTAWAKADAEEFVTRAVHVAHKHERIIIGWERTSDVMFSEPHTGGRISLRDKGFEIRQTKARARIEGKPTVTCTPYAHLYYVGLSKPAPHMRQEFREIAIAHSSPWPVIWDWECIRDPRGFPALGTVFAEVRDHEPYLDGAVSLKHAALLVSAQTSSVLGEAAHRHVDAAKGWYDALSRAHIPVDVILDEEITPGGLAGYRVLILANVTVLGDVQAAAVEAFVAAGGGLVATYKTSLYDEEGGSRSGFALANVLGCEYQAEIDAPWTYIGLTGTHPVSEGFDPGFLIMHGEIESLRAVFEGEPATKSGDGQPVYAYNHLKVDASNDAEVLATVFESARPLGTNFLKDLSPAIPGSDSLSPAIVARTIGEGLVLYFAGQVDRLFYEVGHPDHERLLLNGLSCVASDSAVGIKAPTTVESAFYEQPGHGRLVIHLLNHTYDQMYPTPAKKEYGSFSGDVFRPVGDVIPIRDIEIKLRAPFDVRAAKAYSPVTSQEMSIERHEGEAMIRLGELAEYDLIIVECGAGREGADEA